MRLAWMLVAPSLAVLLVVAVIPLLQTVFYSFTDARLGSLRPWHWVGLRNYVELWQDVRFLNATRLTLGFTLVTVTLEAAFGLVLALFLNRAFRGRAWLRAAVLVPWAIPTVMSTQMWKWMLHDVYGLCNDLALRLGLIDQPIAFIADPRWVFASVCAVDVWKTTPFMALLLLAGLQLVPDELAEAAHLDGANALQRFVFVTLPLLLPMLFVALVFRTLDALRTFDLFFVMVGNLPRFQTLAVLNQQVLVDFSRVGEGSAVSITLFGLIALFVALYARLVAREA